MADAIERVVRDVGRNVWPPLRDFLQILLWVGWSGAWLLVALIGWLFSLQTMITVSLTVLAVSVGLGLTVRTVKKRRLKRAAQTSLVARAKRDRLRLPAETEAILEAFDLTQRTVTEMLKEPALAGESLSSTIVHDVEKAREHLWSLVTREVGLDRDLRQLGRFESVKSVTSSSASMRDEIRRTREEADGLVVSTRRIAERLKNLQLASGASRPAVSRAELESVVEDLDRTAAAYREIDDSEQVEQRARERMRAKARAAQTNK